MKRFIIKNVGRHIAKRSISTSITYLSSVASVSDDGKKVVLSCDGELERRYHSVWLRHNCRCPECLPPFSHKMNIVFHENLKQLRLIDAKVTGNDVVVNWTSELGPHSCNFNIDWLKKHDYTTPGAFEAKKRLEEPLIATSLPTVDYAEIEAGDEGLYKWLKQINFYGMSLIENVPPVIGQIEKVCTKVHDLQPHCFDLVYDVLAMETPDDIAYTNEPLMMHMDQGFLESNLGMQILHCLEFDDCVEGGETFLVDVYAVVEDLRQKHLKHFKTLSTVPYKTEKVTDDIGIPHNLEYQRLHICLNGSDQVVGINWSPQYHAPLAVHEDKVEDYYEAFITLSDMIKNYQYKVEHRLKVGDALTYSNRRMAHGRNGFTLNGGKRHFRGLYLNADFVRSMFQVLANKYEPGVRAKRCFNNSWSA